MSFSSVLRLSTQRCCCRSSSLTSALQQVQAGPAFLRLTATAASRNEPMMPFEEYIKAKNGLKWKKRVVGGVGALFGAYSSVNAALYFKGDELMGEEVEPIWGMDPLFLYSLGSCGVGVLCFAVFHSMFSVVYKLLWRSQAKQMEKRDQDFFERIARHRFARESGFNDDFYGERIKSVSDYRQWVRTQQKRRADVTGVTSAKETTSSD